MPTFILKEIDDTLWRKVKSKAAMEGVSLKDLVLGLIVAYVDKEPAPRKAAK